MFEEMEEEVFGPEASPLCRIFRVRSLPPETHFPVPPETPLQVGYVVHPEGHEIPRHMHAPIERHLTFTTEVLLVLKGRCEVDVYDEKGILVATRVLARNDVLVMTGGGHGFRMLEDTVLFEVKQGPYPGPSEKAAF